MLVVVWVAPEESGLKRIAAAIWWTRLLARTAVLPNNRRCSENIPLVGLGEAAVKLTVVDEHGVELEDASLCIACPRPLSRNRSATLFKLSVAFLKVAKTS